MQRSFPETLSALRRDKNISQRKAAADLNISLSIMPGVQPPFIIRVPNIMHELHLWVFIKTDLAQLSFRLFRLQTDRLQR